MQMHPAPRPPMGIATWVALSPLKVRCGPACVSSEEEKGTASWRGELGASGAGRAAGGAAGAAAASAAVDEARRNSRRVGFLSDMQSLQRRLW